MATKSSLFRPKAALFCDDVRQENNGKLIIIGAYVTNIAVWQFPANLIFHCLVIGDTESPFDSVMEFRALFDGEAKVSQSGKMTIGHTGGAVLHLAGIALQNISKPGLIEVQFRQDGGAWQKAGSIPVELIPR